MTWLGGSSAQRTYHDGSLLDGEKIYLDAGLPFSSILEPRKIHFSEVVFYIDNSYQLSCYLKKKKKLLRAEF